MTGRADPLYGDDLIGRLTRQPDGCPAEDPLDICIRHEGKYCYHPNYKGGYVDIRYVEKCVTCHPRAQACPDPYKHEQGLTDSQGRPDWDEYAFELAKKARTRSTCVRAQIGGVALDKHHRIVATFYNGAPSGATHCIDLPAPIVFAGHDMHCDHAEENLVAQLRALFDSVSASIYGDILLPDKREMDVAFAQWIQGLDLTIYLHGGRDVCTHCAKLMYESGIRNEPKVRHP